MQSLPDKPSELILLALQDLADTEKDPRYLIDMSTWHRPMDDNLCHVCLAGAVLAQRDERGPTERIYLNGQDSVLEDKLFSLNNLRSGIINWADFGYKGPRYHSSFPVTEYEKSPKAFKKDLRELARQLAKGGW